MTERIYHNAKAIVCTLEIKSSYPFIKKSGLLDANGNQSKKVIHIPMTIHPEFTRPVFRRALMDIGFTFMEWSDFNGDS